MTDPGVLQWDPMLKDHIPEINKRIECYKKLKVEIDNNEGGLSEFSKPFSKLGFSRTTVNGEEGLMFREWLPNAARVSLIGDFNNWDREQHTMTRTDFGVFEVFLPDHSGTPAVPHLSKYKIHIHTNEGETFDRIPAYATYTVQDKTTHAFDAVMWTPEQKFEFKHDRPARPSAPRIYESHVGIGSRESRVGTYKEFEQVVKHCVKCGYNTIQLMAIQEHSYYASFGYHVTNFFAPSSRCGTPEELKELIDCAHSHGLTVLMDLVHSHASSNANDGIGNMDGSGHHFFHEGKRGYHELWDSKLFNYGNWEVLRFLLSNLRYWMEEFNFDGFRFDGVTSMLYVHHGLGTGFSGGYHEYFGDQVDVDAVSYLMLANDLVHSITPNALTIAEDVSGMPTLCRPVSEGGMGFDFRLAMAVPDLWIKLLKESKDEDWQMGHIAHTLSNRRWMEPVICYAESHDQALVGDKTIAFWLMDKEMYTNFSVLTDNTPVVQRGIALHKLIRGVTHSLGGEGWLAFMGNEFGHPEWLDFPREGNDWSYHYARRQWNLVEDDLLRYKFLLEFDKQLNDLEDKKGWLSSPPGYISRKHEGDKVLIFERGGLIFVFNFHPTQSFPDYRIGVDNKGKYKVVLDSDAVVCGGAGCYDLTVDYLTKDVPWDGRECSMLIYTVSRTMLVFAKVD